MAAARGWWPAAWLPTGARLPLSLLVTGGALTAEQADAIYVRTNLLSNQTPPPWSPSSAELLHRVSAPRLSHPTAVTIPTPHARSTSAHPQTAGLGLTSCEVGRFLTVGSPSGGGDGRALIFVHIPQGLPFGLLQHDVSRPADAACRPERPSRRPLNVLSELHGRYMAVTLDFTRLSPFE